MLNDVLFWLGLVNLLVVVGTAGHLAWGHYCLRQLKNLTPPEPAAWPRVSIVVAARNEARDIENGVRSLLALDYPNYELLVVNDRSTDATGEILERIARENSHLQVVHITELPSGWLGKNHALDFGSQRATGEWLLFTDADVVFEPSILRRTVALAEAEQIDHVALLPEARMPTLPLQAFVITFMVLFALFFRPWKARDPKSSAFIGVGAFNLLRRRVYHAIGTLKAIAMRPDDDVKLGKLVKKHGFVQDGLGGVGFLHVPWYASVREVINGLMKNAFSGVDYQVHTIVYSSCMLLTFDVFPFLVVWIARGPAWWLYAGTVLVLLGICLLCARAQKANPLAIFLFPLAVLLFVYIQWRAMFLTFWNDGIHWRDTHYSLAELRANKV